MDRSIVLAIIVHMLIYWSDGQQSLCRISANFARKDHRETLDTVVDCDTNREFGPTEVDYERYGIYDQLWWNGSQATSSLYRLALDTVFDPSRANQLKFMVISGFHVDVLRANTFYNFNELQTLHLEQNHIFIIASDTFNGLQNLKTLYLHENGLYNIFWKTFEEMNALETLIIDERKVKRLNVNLESLTNLEELQIKGVKMISQQTMGSIFSPKAGKMRALKSVDIADTHIETNFTLKLDYNDEKLKHLSIVNSNLTAICAYLPNVEHLNLKRNSIRSEIYLELYNMRSLRVLDLRGNLLRSLRGLFCESCRKLETVYLNDNRIHFVAFDAFSNHRRLELLDFTNNSLTRMRPEVQTFLYHVSTIIPDDNPWDCRWLEETLQYPDEVFEKFSFKHVSDQINVKGLGCVVYPDPTTTTEVVSTIVSETTMEPPENLVEESWMLLMSLTVTLIFLSCVILALVVWNNRDLFSPICVKS
jgi:Leucine rich repeat